MIEYFLEECNEQMRKIRGDHLVGVFLHGSLVLRGGVPEKEM
ncbi:hypothetical protein [Halobacillus trueperi]|nr:hypothetical protein [Halobacillus trueperi]